MNCFTFLKMSSLKANLQEVYEILKAKQPEDAHKINEYDCETHIDDYSQLGYWKNKLLPPDVNGYNKWYGDNVQYYHKGVVILLPTYYSFRNWSRCYSRKQLTEIILNPDNYEFHNDGMQTTNTGICTQWDAEIKSLDEYFSYLIGRGYCL